jgi:hypothetical protein
MGCGAMYGTGMGGMYGTGMGGMYGTGMGGMYGTGMGAMRFATGVIGCAKDGVSELDCLSLNVEPPDNRNLFIIRVICFLISLIMFVFLNILSSLFKIRYRSFFL